MKLQRLALLAASLVALPALAKRGPYPLLPAQLKDRYLAMKFTADGGEKVDIKLDKLQYQNPHFKTALPRAPLKDKFLGLANAELKKDKAGIEKLVAPYKIKNNDQMYMRVFSGEGTPEQVQAVLQLASRFKSRLGQYWKDKGDLSASLKDFYWNNIGLNCNGFVGSYARAVGAKQTSDTPVSAYAPPGKRIKKLGEILPGDVLVWKNGAHIVAIQGKRSDGKFDAVESAGSPIIQGLGSSRYELRETGGDVIKATPINLEGKKGGQVDVYIASLK